ncbi:MULTISPECIES: glycerophosphodiester phosphodiesterase [Bacillaceae]|uniref:glycerophosphodiester phosphodiesterase n=1 Tax=Bacillaceae TaxID=186817 RepID=UPI001BDE593B|nr:MULTISPECIES: glycerophosphodiester phosphodiesterase [Bacillaceae]MDX8360500.1 glycerophosphodiester phosphodiesterase [Cytobacillus sp. IB215316]
MSTLVYAHRGASKLAPENTMTAFLTAEELGADGIELDVQLSKDNIPVIIHDETLNRTTNGVGYVKDYTAKELEELDAGSWFTPLHMGEKIPTLDHFLSWFSTTKMLLNLELKNSLIEYKGIEQIVCDMLKAYKVDDRTVISSFNHHSIKNVMKIDPQLDTAFLVSSRLQKAWESAKNAGTKSIHVKHNLLSKQFVDECRKENMTLRTYTVNRPLSIRLYYKWKVDGIITDVPNTAVKIRKKMSSSIKKRFLF